jgi:hypothetical protein
MQCKNCDSNDTSTKSIRKNASGTSTQRYQCNSCSKWFSELLIEQQISSVKKINSSKVKRWVITSIQNNASINKNFCQSLQQYCLQQEADLLIIPIIYRPDDHELVSFNIPEYLNHTLVRHKMKIHDEVFVMGSFNFIPTTVNPLQGLESLSKGDTLIVPSPQLRMKSLAVSATRHPAILHTTGAISNPEYTNTKVGEKALFNHSYSAVVVEIDSDNDFHVRTLNSDESGEFYDLGYKYSTSGVVTFESPEALVTGDEHGVMADPIVEQVTYTNHDSIVRMLKPKYVVRHDVLDCSSINHHTRKDNIKNIGRSIFGTNKIEDELAGTVDYLLRTSQLPDTKFESIIVESNHNSHLTKWFSEIDIKTEPQNAKFYHKYMWKILDSMVQTTAGFNHINPFEQFCKDVGVPNLRFLGRDESFTIADIELGTHSDKGTNGSRGSIAQFANLPYKYVIGHSHTPGIIFGAYQVGTSSYKKLDYTSGLSSWMHCHCLVYKNGKRQLINIINGKWKA